MAVQSRIHLAVIYEDLSPEQIKQVWNGFLSQLNNSNMENKEEIQEWVNKWAIKSSLNGRQIRNIISSAQALARGRGRRLTLEDIEQVKDATEDFQKDLHQTYQERRIDALAPKRRG
jgi:hypothetical protein